MEATLARPVDFEALLDFCISKAQDPRKGDFILEAFAATSDLDLQGDVITPAAIKASAKDLEKNSTVLDNHDPNKRVGAVLKSEARPGGLWVQIRISETVPHIRKQIEENVLNKLSIRGQVIEREIKHDDDGRKIIVIHKMYLTHVAVVSVPANTEARSLRWYIAKALGGENMPEEKKIEEVKDNNSGKEPEIEKTKKPDEPEKPAETVKLEVEKKEPTPEVKAEVKKPEAPIAESVELAQEDLVLKAEFTPNGYNKVVFLLDKISANLANAEKVAAFIQQIKAMLGRVSGAAAAFPYPTPYPYPKPTVKTEEPAKAEKQTETPESKPSDPGVEKTLGEVVRVVSKMADVIGEMKGMMPGSSMRKSHIETGGSKQPEPPTAPVDIMTDMKNAVGEMLGGA